MSIEEKGRLMETTDEIGGGYLGNEHGFVGAGPLRARMAARGGGFGTSGFWGTRGVTRG